MLSYSSSVNVKIPAPQLFNEFGIHVMTEIVACTGCRPKVVRHLRIKDLTDSKPGFNPHDCEGEDTTIEEEIDGQKFRRRLDPNLPPKEKACIHQLADKSAICSEKCDKECVPDGFNIYVIWDKTYSKKGGYFLHIPTPIKKLIDRFDIIRTNFFKNQIQESGLNNNEWFEDDDCPFFLTSRGKTVPFLDLKNLSKILEIDITAYSLRRIVCTWALTHKLKEIRDAEEESLQHSIDVAKKHYLQGKQVVPQNLVQTYAKEENLFPKKFKDQFTKDKNIDGIIEEKKNERLQKRIANLIKNKDELKKYKFEKKILGPRNSILEIDRKTLLSLLEKSTGKSVEYLLELKPNRWRDTLVRIVCSAEGEIGEQLRALWIKIYKGDLKHGIRDKRKEAKNSNWPIRKAQSIRRDRNSWIASELRKNSLAVRKKKKLTHSKGMNEYSLEQLIFCHCSIQ